MRILLIMLGLSTILAPLQRAWQAAASGDAVNVQPSAGYHAAESSGKRASPSPDSRTEDQILPTSKRDRITAGSRDLTRNFALFAWAIRTHVKYVAEFDLYFDSEDSVLNEELTAYMKDRQRRENCDVAGRHRFDRMLRLMEARRTGDGDIGVMQLDSGHSQLIEGDRIRNPIGAPNGFANEGINAEVWYNGVRTGPGGKAISYAINSRRPMGGWEFEREVPADSLFLHGYYDRADAVRGISPFTSGLNSGQDMYEVLDLTRAKLKVHQLFALAIYNGSTVGTGIHEEEVDDEDEGTGKYNVDLGQGPIKIELEDNDRAEFLESKTPSQEFKDFTLFEIMLCLKSLDIPYCLFDESSTVFHGFVGSWNHYERSCDSKREDNIEYCNAWTDWQLRWGLRNKQITLPRGWDLSRLKYEWSPIGMPWYRKGEEINGDLASIAGGLDNPERICRRRGTGSVYRNIDETARVLKYAQEQGVTLSFTPVMQPVQVMTVEDVNNNSGKQNNGGKA